MSWFARIVLCLYGVVLIVGGYMGYHEKGSLPSLLWGAVSGVVALGAFFLTFQRPRTGLLLGLVVAVVVAVRMGTRFAGMLSEEGSFMEKFMPGGMIATVSAGVAILCLIGACARKKTKKNK